MKRICVFCGSNPGTNPAYLKAARQIGTLLAEKGIGLVYGGASIGVMGEVADAALKVGGEVIGIIPKVLAKKEIAHPNLSDLKVVESMHARKALMAEVSDGFIALPGGLGTFEELFEILTWAQLGLHAKPCGLLNVAHYYDKLVEFLKHAVGEQFIKKKHHALLLIDKDPTLLLAKFESFQAPKLEKVSGLVG